MTWEQRWHPLREEWVIIAAHRQNRPWSGETLDHSTAIIPPYVDDCYLCPGNARISGAQNPDYAQTFVFDNDAPCVDDVAPQALAQPVGLYRNRAATGKARVVCYSPLHNVTLAELALDQIDQLMRVWQAQYLELGARPEVNYVLVFENKGEAVGVSNPHPHCQIYATNFVFKTIEVEANASQAHLQKTGRVLFQDILAAERQDGRRVIAENDHAIAFVPYFARYAYEVYVAPKATHPHVAALSDRERLGLAEVLKKVLVKFDNLWQMSFPYVMPLHQIPTDGGTYAGFHFFIQLLPPLRKPNLLKYLAGPEVGGGNFLSDTAPEEKAAELRAQPDTHYKQRHPS